MVVGLVLVARLRTVSGPQQCGTGGDSHFSAEIARRLSRTTHITRASAASVHSMSLCERWLE
jgi:hypothetical protein